MKLGPRTPEAFILRSASKSGGAGTWSAFRFHRLHAGRAVNRGVARGALVVGVVVVVLGLLAWVAFRPHNPMYNPIFRPPAPTPKLMPGGAMSRKAASPPADFRLSPE
jgi:hypothetical protein